MMQVSISQLYNLIEHRDTIVFDEVQGIELQETIEDDDYLHAEEFIASYRKLMEESHDPHFGLHFGCFLNIKALGFVTYVQKSATRFDQTIKLIQDYLDESFPLVTLEVKEDSGQFQLILGSNIHDDDELSLHILDAVFAFIFREFKLLLSADIMFDAILPYQKLDEYARLLNIECTQGTRHAFYFHTDPTKTEINQRTPEQIAYLLPRFLQLLEETRAEPKSFRRQVKIVALSMCTPEVPSLVQVLTQFPMSKRSFQRRLANANASYREIANDIKCKLYDYLAMGQNFKVQDIAFILGYSDTSALLHARSKWVKNKP